MELKGWIKHQLILPGEIKKGRTVVIVNDTLSVAKVHNLLENDKVVVDVDDTLYTVDAMCIGELVVEYLDTVLKVIPLKHTQWASSLLSKEVNTGRLVRFIIKGGLKPAAKVITYRKISVEEIDNLTYDAYKQGAEDQQQNKFSLSSWEEWRYKQA